MTIQVEEKIIMDGEQYELLSRPFEPFIKELGVELIPFGSHCWRGYIGTWEIQNNVLYMTGIKLNYNIKDEAKLAPLKIVGVIHQATWYSGKLLVALVEPTWYHPNYHPMYTKVMHLTVENGLITNHEIVENDIPEIEDNGLPF